EGELPDGAAVRTESSDSFGRADAVGTEVETAIGSYHVHVREVEPVRDHRGGSLLGIELHDVAREWVRGTGRRPHIDEVDVLVLVGRAAGHVLDERIIDELCRSAVHPVQVAGKSSQPERIACLRDAARHPIGPEPTPPPRAPAEPPDAPTAPHQIQRPPPPTPPPPSPLPRPPPPP